MQLILRQRQKNFGFGRAKIVMSSLAKSQSFEQVLDGLRRVAHLTVDFPEREENQSTQVMPIFPQTRRGSSRGSGGSGNVVLAVELSE